MCRSYFVEYRARGCGPSCQTSSYDNCARQRKTRNCLDLEIYPTWITNDRCPYHARMKREDRERFYAELREQDRIREEEEERKRRESQEGIQRLEMGEKREERGETRTSESRLTEGTGAEGASTAENGNIQKSRKVESDDDKGTKMSKSSKHREKQSKSPHHSREAPDKPLDVRAPDSSPLVSSVAVPSFNSSIPLLKALESSPSTNFFNPSAPAFRSIVAASSHAYAPPLDSPYSPISPQSPSSSSSSESLFCPYNTPSHLLFLRSSTAYNSKVWEPLFQLIDSKEVSFATEERKGGFGSSMFEYTGVGIAEGGWVVEDEGDGAE